MSKHKTSAPVIISHARFIVDTRDASKDVWIESLAAQQAYKKGEIGWDVTNKAYCSINPDRPYPPATLVWHDIRTVMQG